MKKSLTLLVLLLAIVGLNAQTYNMDGSQTQITTCAGTIYDHGGSGSNYGPGRSDWLTIYPGNGVVSLRIMDMDIAETDTLYFYNGIDPSNDSIPLMIGSVASNWVNNGNIVQLGDQEVTATIQNPNGAITLHFVSAANSEGGAGYELSISCAQPCQRLYANIDFANSHPTPHFDTELNDGYYYIDYCPGDTIHVQTYATYPDNNVTYFQTEGNTLFNWSSGQSGYGMSTLDQVFTAGQGFDLTLTLSDVNPNTHLTCLAQTPVAIRLRGSADPFTSARLLEDVCEGTEIPLLVSLDSAATILVHPVGSTQESSLAVDSTVFIPDGPYCATECYYSSVNFTSFPPAATVQAATDILGVRLNLEHSYQGDVNISLVCPNNQRVMLKTDHNSNSSSYFGLMYEPDGSYCNSSDNTPGTGWNYCWSENTTYAQNSGSCDNSNNIGHDHSNTIDSSHVAIGYPGQPGFVQGQQYYTPLQSFSQLIGCPLNGLWQIEVCDTWGSDNGYIFSWELTLDPNLMPQDWTYDVDITGINWAGGNIQPTSDSTATIITDQPGDYTYTFTLVDEFGCQYDHDMPLKVVPQPQFTLTDQNICVGETATLDPQYNYPGTPGLISYNWNTGATTSTITTNQSGDYNLTINCFNNDHTLTCSFSDTVAVIINPQPVADFEADLLENCSPLKTTLSDLTTYSDGTQHPEIELQYDWSILDADGNVFQTSNASNPQIEIPEAGLYTVQLIVHTPEGCGDTLVKTDYLTVFPQPISDFLSNPERTNMAEMAENGINFINITDTTVFSVNDVITWTWNYGDGSDETHETNGAHTYDSWGEFVVTLSVETDKGCASTVSHTVYVEEDLVFPNVMTPNGDGVNDVFAIKNMNPLLPNVLSIYNRWGKKVYEKENYQSYIKDEILYNEGDGFNAESLSDGVYYFTFHYEGYTRAVDYHGSLTIIRNAK